jgi:hypothetical protein
LRWCSDASSCRVRWRSENVLPHPQPYIDLADLPDVMVRKPAPRNESLIVEESLFDKASSWA